MNDVAEQIADLINSQNRLAVSYEASQIDESSYVKEIGGGGEILGVVKVDRVQWYQCEIHHLSVKESHKRQGIGSKLLEAAERRAKKLGARIVQCTVRVGNTASERLFEKHGYVAAVTFVNSTTGNELRVYQKAIEGK